MGGLVSRDLKLTIRKLIAFLYDCLKCNGGDVLADKKSKGFEV